MNVFYMHFKNLSIPFRLKMKKNGDIDDKKLMKFIKELDSLIAKYEAIKGGTDYNWELEK